MTKESGHLQYGKVAVGATRSASREEVHIGTMCYILHYTTVVINSAVLQAFKLLDGTYVSIVNE